MPESWPTTRSRRSSIVAQFGEARADLVGWALTTGDPLADAVVDEIHEHGRAVNLALTEGLGHGLASLTDPPPAVAALLRETETLPDYVDDALLDEASLPHFSSPAPVHILSLSAGSLVHVYESPSISKVLATTGKLIEGAPRRLAETGKWIATALLPGALRRGNPGYVATIQVRMLHAHMRRLARNRGYDEAADGVPINQIDLARTWMDFTLTSYTAEQAMGFGCTSNELASLYRYWWYVGHLLGVSPRLVEGISSHDDARRVADLLQAVTGPAIPESSELAFATCRAIAGQLNDVLSLPRGMGLQAMYALTRRFHGHAVADELGLPHAFAADRLLTPAISAIRLRRTKLRRDPAAWRREIEKGVARAKSAAEGTDAAA
ncbi:oxygenase MpaB family protein [Amycolatopsis sp. NPDC001319]|uniref:oxygenase MpaB family protein n=1 Tax=unclassified Amycolatopsis TaxID=2618356 RepID=UPI0036B67188